MMIAHSLAKTVKLSIWKTKDGFHKRFFYLLFNLSVSIMSQDQLWENYDSILWDIDRLGKTGGLAQ